MNKRKSVKIIIAILVLLLISLGIYGYIKYQNIEDHNKEIEEIEDTDSGTFLAGDPEYAGDPGNGVRLYLHNLESMDVDKFSTEEEKEEELERWHKYGIDPRGMKEPCFMFKYGYDNVYSPDNFVFGTWKRNKKGDYTLTADGKVFAYIIQKKNVGFIQREKSDFVLIIVDTGEEYYIQKTDWCFSWFSIITE